MCLKWPLLSSSKSVQPVYNRKARYLPTTKKYRIRKCWTRKAL